MSETIAWTAADGTAIRGRIAGPADGPLRPVVCLPGLTRNHRDFESLVARIAGGDRPRRILAVDFRGRGLSDRADPATYRPDVEAADVLAGLDLLGWSRPAFVGTSRGGIVTMLLAASSPDRVGPVVLNDIGPVIETAGLAAISRRMGETVAARDATWTDVAGRLRGAMGRGFPLLDADGWLRIARRLYADGPEGHPVPDYDPRLYDAFASFDPGVGLPPFWPVFEALAGRPVLAVRGENSDLLSEETLAEMAARLPGMDVHRVPGEGHAPLLDDEATLRRIGDFLDAAG